MTEPTPGCGSNSEARKRQAETVGRDAIHVKVDELAQVKAELDRLREGIEALADRWKDYGRTAPTDLDQHRWWSCEASLRALLGGGPDVRDDLQREFGGGL